MRICHVLQTPGGGANRVMLDLAAFSLHAGHSVTVVYSADVVDRAFEVELFGVQGLIIHKTPMQRKVGLRDIVDSIRLARLLKKIGPFDIVHAHSSKAGALVRIFNRWLTGAVIYTPHCFYSMSQAKAFPYGHIERLLSLVSCKIVAVSSAELQHALKIGISKRRLRLIPNGVCASNCAHRAEVRRALGIPASTFVVGFIGRLEAQKNPLRAIEAYNIASKGRAGTQLIMIGDGSLRDQVERCVADSDGAIVSMGGKKAKDIISSFDCLLCSSDFEALPIVFLEALAAGVPIVSTPVGGTHEAVKDGYTGFVSVNFSSKALSDAIGRLFALDTHHYSALTLNCLALSSRFTLAMMGSRYLKLYAEFNSQLLGCRGKRS